MQTHDLIGIGFGPSNIALAIALDEKRHTGQPVDALFIEKQAGFTWHKDMVLDHAHMQISFLKDLATLRNPTSRFTFVNYLHEKQRLPDFINLKTFYPSRQEFSDYLGWAAAQFADRCAYAEDVFEILPERQGDAVSLLRVRSRCADGSVRERLARNLVVSMGGTTNIPEAFRPFKDEPRVFHSHNYLSRIDQLGPLKKVAVVGGGQSAAEIFMELHGRDAHTQVDLIMRARAIRPSDDSPFVNEIFNADFTDYVYGRSEAERANLFKEFWHTNYSAPDLELVQQIFKVLYEQKVAGKQRHRLLRSHQVQDVRAGSDGIHLRLVDLDGQLEHANRYDAVILATGYERQQHKSVLAPLAPYLGDFTVDRNYRVHSAPGFRPQVFLQGACEATHGFSDTLLSVTAVRTEEIRCALEEGRDQSANSLSRAAADLMA